MEIKSLLTDEEAVSPVIGVILMVAITVILAAVIGTFVLGLGDQVQDNAPQASMTFDYDETAQDLQITHDGGDKIPEDRLDVKNSDADGTDSGTAFSADTTTWSSGSDVTAGDSMTAAGVDPDMTVRIVWTSESAGNSATLGKFSGPDA